MFDRIFSNRDRAIYTCGIYLSEFVYGWYQGAIGPALLDFMDNTEVSFSSTATYIVALDIGMMAGSMFTAVSHLRLNPFVVMSVMSLTMTVFLTVLPWCSTYISFFFVMMFNGIPLGFQTTFSVAETKVLWERDGANILLGLFSLRKAGAIVSTLTLIPFLKTDSIMTLDDANSTISPNLTHQFTGHSTSRLYIPFTIYASCSFLTAVIFTILLVFYCKGKFRNMYSAGRYTEIQQMHSVTYKIIGYSLIFLGGLMQYMISSGALEFLSAFFVQQYNVSRKTAAYISILYMTCAFIGRLFCLFLRLRFEVAINRIFTANSLIIVVTSGIFFAISISTQHNMAIICVCIAVISLAVHPNASFLISLIDQTVIPVTGNVANMFIIASLSGGLVAALLKGFLMETWGSILFPLLLFAESLILMVLTVIYISFPRLTKHMVLKEAEIALLRSTETK